MAADYQAESKSAAVQSGESEIATGDAVTTATAATIEPTITPAEPPAAEPTATPLVTPYPVQDSDTTDFEIGAQNAKCKLTGVYFANKKDYPDAETQVRSKSKNRFSIGGKSVWDLGWIAVEPADGMTVESIMDSKGTAVGTTTWGEAKKLISASGMEVSEKAYAAMDGKSDDTMVIYMDRNTYNQYIFYNNIIIRLKNSDGNTENVEIKVQDSHYWINKTLSLGEKIKPLSLSEVKKLYDGRAVSKDEFNIRKSTINGSPEDCLIESSDGSDEYIANRVGMAMVDYTDKKTGMSFEVDINIKLPDNKPPLHFVPSRRCIGSPARFEDNPARRYCPRPRESKLFFHQMQLLRGAYFLPGARTAFHDRSRLRFPPPSPIRIDRHRSPTARNPSLSGDSEMADPGPCRNL